MLGILGSSVPTVLTALTDGLQTIGDDMMKSFIIIIPSAFLIIGAKMLLKFGVGLFSTLTKKG